MSKSRFPWLAAFLIVVLRLSIGWQFLYEGLWKYDTLDTPAPWSAEGYLKAAQGPFRDRFRDMTGDPDDLSWLDFETVSRRWYGWRDRFVSHYRLDESQQAALNRLIDGVSTANDDVGKLPPRSVSRSLKALPEGVDLDDGSLHRTFQFKPGQLIAVQPVLPSEEAALKAMAPDDEGFQATVSALAEISRRLTYRERLAAMLRGDPDRVGVIGRLREDGKFEPQMGTVTAAEEDAAHHNIRYGKIQEYKDLVRDYEAGLDRANIDFEFEHMNMLNRKLQMMKAELVGPVRALDAELKRDAVELLTAEQLAQGALPPENTPVYRASMAAMWALIVVGGLLLVGLITRPAALAGAVLLTMFYLVMPPWPGVPQAPGPEHSLIINKNAIEVIALLVIAALPTGTWFGIDGVLARMFGRHRMTGEG